MFLKELFRMWTDAHNFTYDGIAAIRLTLLQKAYLDIDKPLHATTHTNSHKPDA